MITTTMMFLMQRTGQEIVNRTIKSGNCFGELSFFFGMRHLGISDPDLHKIDFDSYEFPWILVPLVNV
jgi:hypothetical protein